MEAEPHNRAVSSTSPPPPVAIEEGSSSANNHGDEDDAGPSTSSSGSNALRTAHRPGSEPPPPPSTEDESEFHFERENEGQPSTHQTHRPRLHLHQQPPTGVSYRFNVFISDIAPTDMRDDVWSCLVVLVTFWFFASITLILGFYGSEDLQLGPNCSRLITTNSIFVQSIKGQQEDQVSGPMLFGFHTTPTLDVRTTWSESHSASVLTSYHQEWVYYLNTGSNLSVSYYVKSPSYASLSLVIAQGAESLVEWVDDPSYPNTTLSWNIIYGSGKIEQDITSSATYYIAVGNLNSDTVEVELNFTINAVTYNTSQASFKCSMSNHVCTFSLFFLGENFAVITFPGPKQVKDADGWYVKVSYEPRWATYFVGSGIMTIIIMAAFRLCNMWQASHEDGARHETIEAGQESQEPLLSPKDDDLSSWGSSYDSVSQDEEDLEGRIQEGKPQREGDQVKGNPRSLCVICYDAPRDCFFLPCGHCAACFPCGSKIAEEQVGTCPICRRKMKKVRKIFSV